MFIRKKIIRDFVQPTWKVIFYESPKTQNPLDKWATGCSKTQNPFSKSKPTQNPKPTFTTQNPLSKPKTHFQNPKPTFKIQSTFCVVKMCLRFSHRNPKPTFTTPNPLSKPKTHFQNPKPTFNTQNPLSKPKTHFQNPKNPKPIERLYRFKTQNPLFLERPGVPRLLSRWVVQRVPWPGMKYPFGTKNT